MDISRGSRRARHVAANAALHAAAVSPQPQLPEETPVVAATAATTAAAAAAPPSPPQPPPEVPEAPPAAAAAAAAAMARHREMNSNASANTASTAAASVHRTPEQPHHHHAHNPSPPAVAPGPPPHPFRLHRSTHLTTNSRLSMPLDSDDSSSEPDLSVLGMARAAVVGLDHTMGAVAYDDEDEDVLSQEQYDDTSIDDEQAEDHDGSLPFDPAAVGLKEISNLGKFTVGSHKPGCGVNELRSDDLKQYWQSDGPQPHKLTVYFVKRVGIRDIRFYVDYNEDESYTPTKIVFKSGTSENNLIEFAAMNLDNPVGWQQVPIAGAGGEPDGNTLVSYVLQMQVLENHQNGKDTHLRGIKIYAFDADAAQGAGRGAPAMMDAMDTTGIDDQHVVASNSHDPLGDMARSLAAARIESGETTFTMPDFMREPEIR